MNLSDLEASLGLVFDDKSLLQRALTHRSYLNENPNLPWLDNERLEFLGDSILGFVTAEYLYHHFPEMKEGDLTSLRAALVRGETLARYALDMGLGPHLLISRGEESAGGRTRRALLAGTFEAIVGAIYMDRGLEAARGVILRLIEPKTVEIVHERLDRNAKSQLQELSQGTLKVTPVYRTVEARGPDHAREFTVEVMLGDRVYGVGHGRNKQTAEQQAAQSALEHLELQVQAELRAQAEAALATQALKRQEQDAAAQPAGGEIDSSETPIETTPEHSTEPGPKHEGGKLPEEAEEGPAPTGGQSDLIAGAEPPTSFPEPLVDPSAPEGTSPPPDDQSHP